MRTSSTFQIHFLTKIKKIGMKLIVLVYIYLSLKYCDCNDKTLLSKIKDIKVTIDHMPSVIIDDIEEPTGKQINNFFPNDQNEIK